MVPNFDFTETNTYDSIRTTICNFESGITACSMTAILRIFRYLDFRVANWFYEYTSSKEVRNVLFYTRSFKQDDYLQLHWEINNTAACLMAAILKNGRHLEFRMANELNETNSPQRVRNILGFDSAHRSFKQGNYLHLHQEKK